MNHKVILKHELDKQLGYMKDLILNKLYDSDTKCLDFTKATSADIYDEVFLLSLKTILISKSIKIKHIICCSTADMKLKQSQ